MLKTMEILDRIYRIIRINPSFTKASKRLPNGGQACLPIRQAGYKMQDTG
jgi:hypothetical protein